MLDWVLNSLRSDKQKFEIFIRSSEFSSQFNDFMSYMKSFNIHSYRLLISIDSTSYDPIIEFKILNDIKYNGRFYCIKASCENGVSSEYYTILKDVISIMYYHLITDDIRFNQFGCFGLQPGQFSEFMHYFISTRYILLEEVKKVYVSRYFQSIHDIKCTNTYATQLKYLKLKCIKYMFNTLTVQDVNEFIDNILVSSIMQR